MTQLDEILNLLQVKHITEHVEIRRGAHIKWLWVVISFMMTTGSVWMVGAILWYAKMEHMARAVDQIYLKVFGFPMP